MTSIRLVTRITTLLFGLMLCLAAPATPEQARRNQLQSSIERGRVGDVVIGADADDVYSKFGERVRLVDLKLEGMLSPALEITQASSAKPSIIAEIEPVQNRLVVTRIQVLDPALRTTAGIGVGSTYGELRSRYRVDRVEMGETGPYVRVEALGISFQLDGRAFTDLSSLRAKVPDGVRIVSLLLTR